MKTVTKEDFKKLYKPLPDSHKGQNGKLVIIGGSHLFHAASLWSLKVASRIVDMVFYSSVPENNAIVQKAKEEFRDGIVVPRNQLEHYIDEADCLLIGPGMVRSEKFKVQSEKLQFKIKNLREIDQIQDEGEQTYYLTQYLFSKYPNKKWVIDAGAFQMMSPEWLKQLNGNVIVTPHRKEFETLFKEKSDKQEAISRKAKEYNCIILLKGPIDIVCSPQECVEVQGGNPGMTKGGTGDVLAGLVAALACKNHMFLAARIGSFVNKKAGDELYKRVGPYFNASDLVDEIPKVMKEILHVQ